MNEKKSKLLIFGAGVIGSLYALRFIQSGMDVTMLARGSRLLDLQKNGLRYGKKGATMAVPVRTIEKLEDDDIYDFIFVTVRYDQAEEALRAIQNNHSKSVVSMTNTVGYDGWLAIVGNRLLPGFPGAGGDIKNGVLYAQLAFKSVFGEIDGKKTERIKMLAKIFTAASLPYNIPDSISAFHVSHAAFMVPLKHFYTDDGMVDFTTAKKTPILRNVALDIKQNVNLLKQAGIPITPATTKAVASLPAWLIIIMYRIMLNISFTRDGLLGNHAIAAKPEVLMLDKAFHSFIKNRSKSNNNNIK